MELIELGIRVLEYMMVYSFQGTPGNNLGNYSGPKSCGVLDVRKTPPKLPSPCKSGVSGFRFWVQGFGVWDLGFRVQCLGFRG